MSNSSISKQVPTEFESSPSIKLEAPPAPQKPLPPLPSTPPLPPKPELSISETEKQLTNKGYDISKIQRVEPQTPVTDEIIIVKSKEDAEIEAKKNRSIFIIVMIAVVFVIIIILIIYFIKKSEGFSPGIPQKQYYRKLYHQPYYDRTNNIYYW